MNQRQKEIIRQKNIISELMYFQKKYLNENVTYQMTPNGDDTFTIKAIEDLDKTPRDLNPEEVEVVGEKPLSQIDALKKLEELRSKIK